MTSPARRALYRAACFVLAATAPLASGARPAAAQTLTALYPQACPAGPCSVRFLVGNQNAAPLLLNTLTLTASASAFAFNPLPFDPTAADFVAQDDASGLFPGSGTLTNGSRTLFINFLDSGPAFELAAGGSGFVDVELAGAPGLAGGAFAFTAERRLAGGGTATVTGSVAVVPEPATVALVAGGLAALGAAARRRRAA